MKKHQKTPFVRAMLALLVLLLFSDSVWASGYCPVHPSQNYVPPMIGYAPRPGPDHPAGPDPDYSSSSRSNNRSSSSTSMSNITYYVDGSINTSLTPKTYNKSSGATLPTPTKAGYIFSGWYSSSNYGGTIFTSISSGCNDDVTLYGKFYANTYTVQFNANDGTNRTETQTFTYDQSQNLTENPFSASTGYGNFIKWTTQSNGTGTSYTNGQNVLNLTATIDGVVNLYAQWTKDIATNSQIHFAVSDQEYTGEEIKPAVTVRDNNTDITEYFTYTYTDNVNAGTATVTISNSTSPLYSGTKTLNFKITKATAKIVNEPLPKTLTYNGNEQELITAGSANSGPVLYSLDDVNYSEEIPTAVKADDYTVYYKVE